MTAELLVNVTPSETRVAYIDGGILQEVNVSATRNSRQYLQGSCKSCTGMQAAFVDIGLDKAAFLHTSDIMPHTECGG